MNENLLCLTFWDSCFDFGLLEVYSDSICSIDLSDTFLTLWFISLQIWQKIIFKNIYLLYSHGITNGFICINNDLENNETILIPRILNPRRHFTNSWDRNPEGKIPNPENSWDFSTSWSAGRTFKRYMSRGHFSIRLFAKKNCNLSMMWCMFFYSDFNLVTAVSDTFLIKGSEEQSHEYNYGSFTALSRFRKEKVTIYDPASWNYPD